MIKFLCNFRAYILRVVFGCVFVSTVFNITSYTKAHKSEVYSISFFEFYWDCVLFCFFDVLDFAYFYVFYLLCETLLEKFYYKSGA